eukprot:m.199176 g.199176  ORF g.199176 m.199176 type:complete len:104 (-) comp13694_c5_seq1:830-1141(-)
MALTLLFCDPNLYAPVCADPFTSLSNSSWRFRCCSTIESIQTIKQTNKQTPNSQTNCFTNIMYLYINTYLFLVENKHTCITFLKQCSSSTSYQSPSIQSSSPR